MASYRGHLTVSAALGCAYGGLGLWQGQLDWGPAVLGAGLTTLGGLLPDLDSDSSVPARELFSLAAAITPLLLIQRVSRLGLSMEQTIVVLAGIYFFIRYGIRWLFEKLTVHRGMFHSIPGMLIAGLLVFLIYHSPDNRLRVYLAGGVMLGFLSHLVLDQLYGIDLLGSRYHPSRHAGPPLKLLSASWTGTLTAYALLFVFGYTAYQETVPARDPSKTFSLRAELQTWLRNLRRPS
jgi:membrane-bound metal-dependent hydrolase YbcI (DUF457 family)